MSLSVSGREMSKQAFDQDGNRSLLSRVEQVLENTRSTDELSFLNSDYLNSNKGIVSELFGEDTL